RQRARLAPLPRLGPGAIPPQRHQLALCAFAAVAEKLGGAVLLADLEPELLGRRLAGARPRLARRGALALHRRREARRIHRAALAAQDVLGKIDGEAIGVVELEGDLARQRLRGPELRRLLLQELQPAPQHLLEAGLLELQRL